MKKILFWVLKYLAKAVLWKHRPFIVAIVGSVGKTTTKDLIHHILRERYDCRKSRDSYNNEIGVPLTVFGADSAGRNPFAWIKIFFSAARLILGDKFPTHLILEFGSDKPGDTAYLMSIAQPDIAVVTRVGEAHMEFYKTLEAAQADAGDAVAGLSAAGTAILNADDPGVLAMRRLAKCRVVTYGIAQTADWRAELVKIEQPRLEPGQHPADNIALGFLIRSAESTEKVFLPRSLGRPLAYAALAASVVGESCGMGLGEIRKRIESFSPPPGRLRVLRGLNGAILIDDSYNAAPEAVIEGLRTLTQVRARRRIAVLGDMLELGGISQSAHLRLGRYIPDCALAELWCIGPMARQIGQAAIEAGFDRNGVYLENDAESAGRRLAAKLNLGDAVLVKGAQKMRLERVVEALLDKSETPGQVLVRQGELWKKADHS